MKVMKKIHVVSECMRRNRIHPLTPFLFIFRAFGVFRGKNVLVFITHHPSPITHHPSPITPLQSKNYEATSRR